MLDKTKANFKAMRESLGMSQQLLADIMDVNKFSVKRWESVSFDKYAPEEAWDILEHYQELQQQVIQAGLDRVILTHADLGSLNEVNLTYWFNEEEYEKAHPGEGRFWQMANANSRILAYLLRDQGYKVTFDFPGLKKTLEKE